MQHEREVKPDSALLFALVRTLDFKHDENLSVKTQTTKPLQGRDN